MLKDDIIQYVTLTVLCIAVIWWNDVNAQERECIVFSLDASGNAALDKYIEDNPEAEQVPIRDVLDEATLRAFGNYNQDSQWIALCTQPVKAYHPKFRHCVDRYPYDDNSKPGKWVCQYDARLESRWSNGNWNEDGEFVPYENPCPNDADECPEANVLDQATIDLMSQ